MRKMILCATLACLWGLLTMNPATAGHHHRWRGYGWRRYYVSSYYDRVYIVAIPAPATLVVNLPADAVLTIDGERTTLTSAKRVFCTPPLEMGRACEHTLEARFVRAGEEKVIKQRVTVRAGEQTTVWLEEKATLAAK
jgi:uncharacterized protein (TIGR03000 family)